MPKEKSNPETLLNEGGVLKTLKRGLGNIYPRKDTYRQQFPRGDMWVLDAQKRRGAIEVLEGTGRKSARDIASKINIQEKGVKSSVEYLTGKTYGSGGPQALLRLLREVEKIEGMTPDAKNEYLQKVFE